MMLTIWLSASLVLEINFCSLFLQPASVGKVDRSANNPCASCFYWHCSVLPVTLPRASSSPKVGCRGPGRKGFPPASPMAALVFLGHLQLPAVTRVQSPNQSPTPPDFPVLSWGQKSGIYWQLTAYPIPPWRICTTMVLPPCTTV